MLKLYSIVSKPILDDSKTFHIYADFTTALDARFAIARLQRFSEPVICRNALNSDDYERADNTITSEKLGMSATAEEFLRSQGWLLNALKAEAAKHGVDVQIVVSSGSNAQAFLSDGLGNAPLPQHAEGGQIAIEFAEYDKEVINGIVPTTEERIPDPAASQLSTPANKQHHFQPSLYSESSLSSFTGELTVTLRPSHIEEDAQWTSLSACSVKAHNTDEMTLERASTSAASLEDDLTNDLVHTQAVLPLDASLETNAGEQNEVGLASVDTTDLVCSKTDDAEIQEGSPPSEISTSPSLAELTAALFTPLLNDTAREEEEQVVSDISSPAHVSIIENHQPLSSQAAEVELSLCETGVRRNNTPLLPSTISGSPIAQRQLSSADLTEALIKATVADREMRASSPISTRIVTDDGHALLSRPIDPQLSSVLGDAMYGTSVTANPNPIITSEAPTVGGSPTSDLTDALLASISDEPDNVWEDINPESPGIITGDEIEHQHIDTVALPTNPEEGKYVDVSATVEKPPVCLDIEDNFSHDLPTGLFICGCSSQAQVMETVIPAKYHQNVASIEEKLGTQYFVVCFDGPQIAKEIFDKLPQVLIETDLDKRSKGAPFVKLLQEDLPSFVGMPTAAQPVKENFTADEETTTIIVTKEGDVKTGVAVEINSGMPVGTPHKEMITSKSESWLTTFLFRW